MLLQFTVENFKSFDGPTHFTMRAGKDKDHPGHVIGPEKLRVVRGAAIYGANAAGKSNLVAAMGFARDLITGRNRARLSELSPFRLTRDAARTSGFHWQFFHDGKLWSYGFDVTKTAIVEEYLFARDESGGKEKKWFERKTDKNGLTSVSLGAGFTEAMTKDDAQLLKLKAPRIDANRFFLRECREEKIVAINPIFDWFEEVLVIVRAESAYEPIFKGVSENPALLKFLSENLSGAGTGLSALIWEEVEFDHLEMVAGEDWSAQRAALTNLLKDAGEQDFIPLGEKSQMNITLAARKSKSGQMFYRFLSAQHGDEIFTIDEESEGTQRFIHLLPHFYRLQTRPTVLVLDEIERRLHTLLTRRLVEMALNSPSSQQNQFVFTTHDTNLLDSALLRRDEIWFVDKDERGASSLASLVEFKVRPDANYEKGYLLGAFDGIPYFRPTNPPTESRAEAE